MKIPTLTEVYPIKKQEQMTKQQTSLLSAVLELTQTIQNFKAPQPDGTLQLRVEELEQSLEDCRKTNCELNNQIDDLTRELDAANLELDNQEKSHVEFDDLKRELDFQKERFKTLQEHYKNSTDYAKEMQTKVLAMENQMATLNLTKPTGFKSWEDAATTERLHHNQTKRELQTVKEQLESTKLKLDRFQKLFREALQQ